MTIQSSHDVKKSEQKIKTMYIVLESNEFLQELILENPKLRKVAVGNPSWGSKLCTYILAIDKTSLIVCTLYKNNPEPA